MLEYFIEKLGRVLPMTLRSRDHQKKHTGNLGVLKPGRDALTVISLAATQRW